jgi:hypothetical protein
MPQKHRKQSQRPIAAAAASTKGAETTKRKGPLTLPEIRELRRKTPRGSNDDDKQLAEAFTLDGADEQETAYLTIFRAIYRRSKEINYEDNAPFEKFVKSLLFGASFWPMTLDDLESALEESRSDWAEREEASRIVREKLNETQRLRKGRDLPPERRPSDEDLSGYTLNECD